MIGQKLGPYQIRKLLASSNSADVYEAWDELGRRQVALKLFQVPASQGVRPRSPNQLPQLQHANLVQLFEQGIAPDGRPYVTMEYVEGIALAAYRRQQNGVVPSQQAATTATSVANTLAFMHQSGRLHLSLRPDAIILRQADQLLQVSYASSDALWGADAPSQRLISNAEYLAPEQFFERPVGARADIYALGLVLYEMLSGRLPYSAVSIAELARRKQEVQPALAVAKPDVDPALAQIVDRALRPDPAQRYESMQAMALDLEAAAGSKTAVPPPVVAKRNSRRLLPLALLVLLAAMLLLMWIASARTTRVTADESTPPGQATIASTPLPEEKGVVVVDKQKLEITSTLVNRQEEGDGDEPEEAEEVSEIETPEAPQAATRAPVLSTATEEVGRISLLGPLCTAPSAYNRHDRILFRWEYDGSLEAGEYLEIRLSPSSGSTSQGAAMQPVPGATWEQAVSIENFATDAENYTWKIVHMAADKSTILGETAGGCFSLRESAGGDSSSGGPSLPDDGGQPNDEPGPSDPTDPGGYP